MALHVRSPLPSFAGVANWVNGEVDAASLEGRPVLVHFWSLSCHLCHESAETVAQWRDTFGPKGLAVVAVHQPRSEAELDVAVVEADAKDAMHLTQPCAVDNEHTLVDRFENAFVPAFYVFDRRHRLRHFQAGDKGHERVAAAIERVLDEPVEVEASV